MNLEQRVAVLESEVAELKRRLQEAAGFSAGDLSARFEAEIRQTTPPNAALLQLAERYPAPDEWQ